MGFNMVPQDGSPKKGPKQVTHNWSQEGTDSKLGNSGSLFWVPFGVRVGTHFGPLLEPNIDQNEYLCFLCFIDSPLGLFNVV